jgi:hypothetical protein
MKSAHLAKLLFCAISFFRFTEQYAQNHFHGAPYPYEFPDVNFRSIIEAVKLNRPAGDTSFIPWKQINTPHGTLVYDDYGRVVSLTTYDPNKLFYKDSLTYSIHGVLIKATSIMDDLSGDTAFKPIYLNAAYLEEYKPTYAVVCDTAYLPDLFCYTFDYYNQCIRVQINNSTDTLVFDNITDTSWVTKYMYRDSDTSQFTIGRIDTIKHGKLMVSLIYYRDSIGKKLANYWIFFYTKDGQLISYTDKLAVPEKPKKANLPNTKK